MAKKYGAKLPEEVFCGKFTSEPKAIAHAKIMGGYHKPVSIYFEVWRKRADPLPITKTGKSVEALVFNEKRKKKKNEFKQKT